MILKRLRFSLVSDGSSDQALLPLLSWLIADLLPDIPIDPKWADLRQLRRPPSSLASRIRAGVELYPCDLLFIHRDAETYPPEARSAEIRNAVKSAELSVPQVCVVPIRMTEAWFLFDEFRIRQAAGNPNGTAALELPKLNHVEGLSDPKSLLHEALRTASGLHGRRLRSFSPETAFHRLAELIDDYSPLRDVPAFRAMEIDLGTTLHQAGWR